LLGVGDVLHGRPEGPRLDRDVKGFKARRGRGIIHTDFEQGFIARTIAYADYAACKGEAGARRR
jgi:hypothetical protein